MAAPNRPVSDDEPRPFEVVRIHVEGEASLVPASITILEALFLSRHRYLRGCGCRLGVRGECAVLVRPPGCRRSASQLACEARVRPDFDITRIPFQWNRAFRDRRQTGR